MDKKSICVIGQLPPPIHGLSVALQTILQNDLINENYSLHQVDIKNNKRFVTNFREILKMDVDLYYFTISQSKFGNIRDMIILNAILMKKKKIIVHYHGGYYKKMYDQMNVLQKRMNKKLLSRINIMVALSAGLKEIFSDVINSNKIRVCENYVEDSSLIDEEEFQHKMGTLENKPMVDVLYLSNFIKSKGYFDVLEAAERLKGKQIFFHFAGAFFNDAEKDEFFQYIETHGLEDHIKYHGLVKGDSKKELLKKCEVFVLPTYYPNEGQPISIIEAMGNGMTIITTKHGGIPDLVKEDNGYIVEAKSPEAIANRLEYLLANKSKLVDIGKNNRLIAMKKYRETHYIHRIDEIFKEVLE